MNRRRSQNSVNGNKQQNNTPEILNYNQYPIIGIDLGISYWSAAIVQNGSVLVIPNTGKNNIPAFVTCLNDEFKFGAEAQQIFFDNQEVTIFDIIYVLGLRFNSGGELETHMNDYSYAICNSGDKPKLAFTNKKRDLLIEELIDIIINNLIYTSEIFLNNTIHNVVVPIPVYFKESQKSALLKATTHVGIIELIFEPIAAAYAYRIHEKYKDDTKDRYFLIYNLQEDNLDISVVHYAKNKFTIKSNLYERHLKRNYTFRFLDELCTQTYETYFISNPRFHPINSGTLRYYCKKVFQDILHADCFEIKMDTIRDEKIVRTISRTELDDLLRILVEESLMLLKNILHEAKLETRDIDEVLLVGQVTRHEIVRQQLSYLFGRHSLNCSLNPEDVLVIGAALRADILQNEIWDSSIEIPNAKPINLESKISTNSVICLENSNKQNQQTNMKENTRKHAESNLCFEDFDRKLLHKLRFKQKLLKNDPIKKKKAKLSLRNKMLSMCNLFTDVVSGSNLKTSVKEKLLFVPSYLRNKLRCRSKSIKKTYDPEEHKNSAIVQENIQVKQTTIPECKQSEIPLKSMEIPKPLDFQKYEPIFDEDKLNNILEKLEKVSSTKPKKKQFYYEQSDDDFYSCLNSERVALNLIPEEVEEQFEEKTKWTLVDKVNCINDHLDMFYVTVCIVVFVLHWASENFCINIAIALVSIAITLILNNRSSTQGIATN